MEIHKEIKNHGDNPVKNRYKLERSRRKDVRKEELRLFLQRELQREKEVMLRELEQECASTLARMQTAMEEYRKCFLESLYRDMKKMLTEEHYHPVTDNSCEEFILINDNPIATIPSFYEVGEVIPAEDNLLENNLREKSNETIVTASGEHQTFSGHPAVENQVKDYLVTIDGDMIEAILDDFIGDEVKTDEEISLHRQVKSKEEKIYGEIDELLAQTGFVPADYQILQSIDAPPESPQEAADGEHAVSGDVEHAVSGVVEQHQPTEEEILQSGDFDAFLALLEKPQ